MAEAKRTFSDAWIGAAKERNREREFCASDGAENERLRARLAARAKVVEAAKVALRDAMDAINRDRTGIANALANIVKRANGAWWITESRGPYEWDDDRYREEAGIALREMHEIAKSGLNESGHLSDVEHRKAYEALAALPADEGGGA